MLVNVLTDRHGIIMTDSEDSPVNNVAEKIKELATSLADQSDTDILFYNGPLYRYDDETVRDICSGKQRRSNVMLIAMTYGGTANAAYRIARCLQMCYNRFTLFLPFSCYSAGTLLAIGAHELVMSGRSELGPLDVQVQKPDELWERESGLAVLEALNTLQQKAFDAFEDAFLSLRSRSGLAISTRSCLDIAEKLAVGLFQPIYGQFEPARIGEMSRSLLIASRYGALLNNASNNLKVGALAQLVSGYPAHDFVIDSTEAQTLFEKIRMPSDGEEELTGLLQLKAGSVIQQARDTVVVLLSKEKEDSSDIGTEEMDENANDRTRNSENTEREGEGASLAPQRST